MTSPAAGSPRDASAGASVLELLREVREELALIAAADQTSIDLLERAAALNRAATARAAAVEERLAHALHEAAAAEFPPTRASRRPRLEEGDRDERERAADARALVERHPDLSIHAVARRCKVSRDVVRRIPRELGVVEKVVENPPKSQEVVEKPSLHGRRSCLCPHTSEEVVSTERGTGARPPLVVLPKTPTRGRA